MKTSKFKWQCVSFHSAACEMKCNYRENINNHILVCKLYMTHKGKGAEFRRTVLIRGGANLLGWKKKQGKEFIINDIIITGFGNKPFISK